MCESHQAFDDYGLGGCSLLAVTPTMEPHCRTKLSSSYPSCPSLLRRSPSLVQTSCAMDDSGPAITVYSRTSISHDLGGSNPPEKRQSTASTSATETVHVPLLEPASEDTSLQNKLSLACVCLCIFADGLPVCDKFHHHHINSLNNPTS